MNKIKTEVTIVQKPVYIAIDCPHCQEYMEIDYEQFCERNGEPPYDWQSATIECINCDNEIGIDAVEWD